MANSLNPTLGDSEKGGPYFPELMCWLKGFTSSNPESPNLSRVDVSIRDSTFSNPEKGMIFARGVPELWG